MPDTGPITVDTEYRLEDRYSRTEGRVFLSGSQALVRLPMMQRQRDVAAGLNTAGFISGYTGSPLGGYDIALNQVPDLLTENHIHFEPGINEDLGATAVWGSQQVGLFGNARYDGVFGIWYGKGPGVDRSGDALKHGSYSGASPHGGVLVLAGDDHGAKSSTIAHQSDHAFIHFGMPFFNPSSVQDYIDFGLHGFAMSRHSGCWVGMKCVTDTIESSASVDIDPNRIEIALPEDENTDGKRSARWMVPALVAEKRQYQERIPAVLAYVRANNLNRTILSSSRKNLAIITTGKSFLDVMQALDDLGLDAARSEALGVSLYKVAMPWPLEPEGISAFIEGNREILVVEEKRPIIEDQIARLLVNMADHPGLLGKQDATGAPLFSAEGELAPATIAQVIADRLRMLVGEGDALGCMAALGNDGDNSVSGTAALARMPSFCAGCPHNQSTKLPEGSVAFGGIGCHGMATFLPERNTPTLFQMGGEGAPWIGIAPFTETPHIFQNLGDGTYYHSGLLAIRAAVAAGVNITYKILVNDAIAMTGGQPIAGKMRVDQLSKQVQAEGIGAIAVVTDHPENYGADADFAPGTTVHHRRELDAVQRRMRDIPGATAIIYDQNCATELRRRRKRGKAEDPDRRPFINPRICEGCGDCSVQSNCIAIEPVETEFGRKRRINQSACNKDFSCLEGYCPSFVTVHGGRPRKRGGGGHSYRNILADVPAPEPASVAKPFSLLVTGIGGSGVVTLGAILGMAAHLEGKGCSVLDVTGLAQRNGPVTSHVRVAVSPEALQATRISAADLVIGSDIVVTASADVLGRMRSEMTRAIVNSRVAPTSDFASNPDLDLSAGKMKSLISQCGDTVEFIEASQLAYALMGNEVGANLMLVGYAAQRGWLPISLAALDRAVELNGTAVEMNRAAIAWGRIAAHDPAKLTGVLAPEKADEVEDLNAIVDRNAAELERYQDRAYADRYRALVDLARGAERQLDDVRDDLARAVAQYYFKLLAYKDEYEVARLLSGAEFRRTLEEEFEGDFRIEYHMAPPILQRRDPQTGRYRKRSFGGWIRPAMGLLAKFRRLRGTPFDIFGYAAHRRLERGLIAEYESDIAMLTGRLDPANHDVAVRIAEWPEQVRGYDTVKDEHIARMRDAKRELIIELEEARRETVPA
ncbi:indolepyruvate ferredoxin oxidoreductase family protein [Parasphingopyxis lamellibrachiae]|uniref:Indolepyruvate ferredoxin oxidoreductase n=1 Tax=Parasphingopyxis lamellibrachiae TaxID=680125 RepID=A0A3D9FGX2_9SPHN|nr:indolepyruvate ferredoxin oxidoreductase family protein [Parasphingopyxis lamellibrachiae]RED16341.1 indolepyruvate ferredoxin oxidoreductase [Parasphingopyxis lamellibrachiae]